MRLKKGNLDEHYWPKNATIPCGTGINLHLNYRYSCGTFIGLMIGVYRTAPKVANKFANVPKLFGWVLNVYIDVFRYTNDCTPWLFTQYCLFPLVTILTYSSSCLHVSINTGAYEWNRSWRYLRCRCTLEAATALDLLHGRVQCKIVLPQVIRNILPATAVMSSLSHQRIPLLERYLWAVNFTAGNVVKLINTPNILCYRSNLLCLAFLMRFDGVM